MLPTNQPLGQNLRLGIKKAIQKREKMKKGTLKTIIILVAMLFINIEAAQAGLVHKFRIYIRHEFSDYQLLYIISGIMLISFLSYIIFTPVLIGKEKWSWLSYYSYNPNRHAYQSKRNVIKKISGILKNV
jgi:hypothetical protein